MSHPRIIFARDWDALRGHIHLGLCCINTVLREQKPPVFCSRTCTRARFNVPLATERALQNVRDIYTLIEYNRDNNIQCLRLSSEMFPHFTDSQTEPYTIDFAREDLARAGELARSLGHRIVMHPGQYNQVGAQSRSVFETTVADLSHQADILDAMGMDNNAVLIVHGGGTYGDKDTTTRRWIDQFDELPKKVRSRLVIENCEHQYSTRDALTIAQACHIPQIFDFHHYECWNLLHSNEPRQESIRSLAPEIIASWGDRRILMHVSEQGSGKCGHHSDYISRIPRALFDMIEDHNIYVDLEVEAKMKEQAIFKLYAKYPLLFNY